MQILARRRKNNPILLGEPGVGKTAIAEGLALAIVNGKGDDGTELPPFLRGMLLACTHTNCEARSSCYAISPHEYQAMKFEQDCIRQAVCEEKLRHLHTQ